MKFSEVCKAYDDVELVFKSGVRGFPVAFPELESFDRQRKNLTKLVTNGSLHEAWDRGVTLFSNIHAKLARTPCRPSWLVNEILSRFGGENIIKELEARKHSVDGEIIDALEGIKESLNSLCAVNSSPLLDPILGGLREKRKVLFLLRDMRLWEEVHSCLAEFFPTSNWELVRPSSLRYSQSAGTLVIFGPAWYLSYKGEEFLLRSPCASEAFIIACKHEFGGEIQKSLIGEIGEITISGNEKRRDREDLLVFEPLPAFQSGGFRFKDSAESKIWESGKTFPAVPFRLGGSLGTYLGRDSEIWTVVPDNSGSIPVCSTVEKIPVDDLEPGALILMTTRGGGDMIPYVADMILRKSSKIRAMQEMWKGLLVEQVVKNGISQVAFELTKLGAQKATPTNVKNWCNPRSIGMEKLQTDLIAVLKMIGRENIYNAAAEGINKLRSAHQSAGAQLQKRLRESLHGKDLGEVFRRGQMEFGSATGPAKTVFLVEERGMEVEVPVEWEGEFREIEI